MAKVLLADESITIQKVVELVLSEEGYEIKAANSGDEALDAVRTFNPDIILADIKIKGKNGYEIAHRIKNNPGTKHIPVMLLAGAFDPVKEDLLKKSGADDFITKPFEAKDLIDKIKELLNETAAPGAALAALADAGDDETPVFAIGAPVEEDDLWEMGGIGAEAEVVDDAALVSPFEAEAMDDAALVSPFEAEGMDDAAFAPTFEAEGMDDAALVSPFEAEGMDEAAFAPTLEAEVVDEAAFAPTLEAEVVDEAAFAPTFEAEVVDDTALVSPFEAEAMDDTALVSPFEAEAMDDTALVSPFEAEAMDDTALVSPQTVPIPVPDTKELATIFRDMVRSRLSEITSGLDFKGVLLEVLSPHIQETVEKILWQVTPELTEKLIKESVRETMGSLNKELENIIWETVPDLAETIIKQEIEKLRADS